MTDATDALRAELQGILDAEMGYENDEFPHLARQLAEAAVSFLDGYKGTRSEAEGGQP